MAPGDQGPLDTLAPSADAPTQFKQAAGSDSVTSSTQKGEGDHRSGFSWAKFIKKILVCRTCLGFEVIIDRNVGVDSSPMMMLTRRMRRTRIREGSLLIFGQLSGPLAINGKNLRVKVSVAVI